MTTSHRPAAGSSSQAATVASTSSESASAPAPVQTPGWPADLGPFAGLSLAWAGRDSLSGAILLDSKLGVQARPGMTARFVAGRSQRLSSGP